MIMWIRRLCAGYEVYSAMLTLTFEVFLEAKGDCWKNSVIHSYSNQSKAHVNNPFPVCKICSNVDTTQFQCLFSISLVVLVPLVKIMVCFLG